MNIQIPQQPHGSYDSDFARWAQEQAARLRARDASLDWDNLAEEIDSLGKSDRRELLSRLTVILEHLLKFQYGLSRDPAQGWSRTILRERAAVDRLLSDSPSLRRAGEAALPALYDDARRGALSAFAEHEAARLTDYERALPQALPFSLNEILDRDFLPAP